MSEKAKIAPTPWRRGIGNEANIVFDAQGRIVATRCGYSDGKLIAAAPDLLEAVEGAAVWLVHLGMGETHPLLNACRAAIQKATS